MSDAPAPPTASNDPRGPAIPVRATTESAVVIPPKPDPFTAKWHRNPFVISFVAGVITLTWLKTRLSYRPEPPPVVGALAIDDWTDDSGEPVSVSAFADTVTVVGFVGVDGLDCGAQHMLSKLWYMFEHEGIEARVATVGFAVAGDAKTWSRNESAAGGERVGWLQAGPTTEAGMNGLTESIASARGPWTVWQEENPRPPARLLLPDPPACDGPDALRELVLVDETGHIRGFFDVHAWEVESEIYHRARHVLAEQAPEE